MISQDNARYLVVLVFAIVFAATIGVIGQSPTGNIIGILPPTPDDATITTNLSTEIKVNLTEFNLTNMTYTWNTTSYAIYNNSLVLMLNFDNVSSLGENQTIVTDVSKYGNNGTIVGAVWNSSGKYGGGFEFDGVSGSIDLGKPASLNISGNITISAWIKMRTPSNILPRIVDSWDTDGDDQGFILHIVDAGDLAKFSVGSGSAISAFAIPQEQWVHLVGNWNGSHINLYVNGSLVNSTSYAGQMGISKRNVVIGNIDIGTREFNGTIDEVRIWNISLTADQIRQQYMTNLNKYGTDDWLLYVNQTVAEPYKNYTFPYQACAFDNLGNENCTGSREITILGVAPPITYNNPTPANQTITTNTSFIVNVSINESSLGQVKYI
ncbi:hypothetical protein CL614_01120, partial [archaeon]|nr:hypothetical protein [archaeon]